MDLGDSGLDIGEEEDRNALNGGLFADIPFLRSIIPINRHFVLINQRSATLVVHFVP